MKQSVSGGGLDDLPGMTIFARVVETRSFTAAARLLDTTTSSVSKRVARLEERLGVRLIERTTRSLSPTEAGAAFYQRCARILRDVEDAEQAVAELGGTPRGTLRVSAMTAVGEAHLAPLVPRFLAEHPALRLDLDLGDRKVNLVEEGFDVAIRGMALAALPDSSLVARRLATVTAVVCGAPSYLARRGVPRDLDDLAEHECLHFSSASRQLEWSFNTPDGPRVIPVSGRIQINNGTALRAAAVAGGGLLRIPRVAVSEALRTGELVPVLEDYAPIEFGVFAVYPAGKQALPKVKAFVDFLLRELPQRLG